MSEPDAARGTVVLTREPPDNDALAGALEAAGFAVLEWPATATAWLHPPGGAEGLRERLEAAELVVFTSRRGVEGARRLLARELASTLGRRRSAAVGPATAEALEGIGVRPEIVAHGRGWRELADRVLASSAEGSRVLLVRSGAADSRLPEALVAEGRLVDDVRLHGPGEAPPIHEAERTLAAVACASPTAARNLLRWNPWAAKAAFVAIGPTTAETLRDELGVERVIVARGTRTEDLLAAIETLTDDEDSPT